MVYFSNSHSLISRHHPSVPVSPPSPSARKRCHLALSLAYRSLTACAWSWCVCHQRIPSSVSTRRHASQKRRAPDKVGSRVAVDNLLKNGHGNSVCSSGDVASERQGWNRARTRSNSDSRCLVTAVAATIASLTPGTISRHCRVWFALFFVLVNTVRRSRSATRRCRAVAIDSSVVSRTVCNHFFSDSKRPTVSSSEREGPAARVVSSATIAYLSTHAHGWIVSGL
jgi:hypothetical protein